MNQTNTIRPVVPSVYFPLRDDVIVKLMEEWERCTGLSFAGHRGHVESMLKISPGNRLMRHLRFYLEQTPPARDDLMASWRSAYTHMVRNREFDAFMAIKGNPESELDLDHPIWLDLPLYMPGLFTEDMPENKAAK